MIFLDVGAHEGQTLEEAVRYEFDRIYAFEPMPAQFERLQERFGGMASVELVNAGLADSSGPRPLYGSNDDMEASLFADKEDVDASVVTECDFIEASQFFAEHVFEHGSAFVKLNCEGAEVPILLNLALSGQIHKAASALVDFDVRRVPGHQGDEEIVRHNLAASGFDQLLLCEDAVPRGRERRAEGTYRYTRADEIMCWLKSHGIAER